MPFVNPDTESGLEPPEPDPDAPPSDDAHDTAYDVIDDPPSLPGAENATDTWPFPGVTPVTDGAPGTDAAGAATSTGEVREVVVSSPSWPDPLFPQQTGPPEVRSAQVCHWPPEIDPTPDESPLTPTGEAWVVVDPSPTCP